MFSQQLTGIYLERGVNLNKECESQIQAEAIKRWPEEMVGYIKGGSFYTLKNISKDPKNRYQLSTKDTLFILNNNVDYLVHSHPTLNNKPSSLDLKSQKANKIPYLIIGTDGKSFTKMKEVS